MLMENSSKKSGAVKIPKRKRSLDLKSIYKSRISAVGESKEKVSAVGECKEKVSKEDDKENVKKKKKRSRKEVSLSNFESDGKKRRKEDESDGQKRRKEDKSDGKKRRKENESDDKKRRKEDESDGKRRKEEVDGVKSGQGFNQKSGPENKVLHGTLLALSEIGSPFIFPRRPRGSVGQINLVRDQVIEPLRPPNSVDCEGAFNGEVIKPRGEAAITDQLVRSVTFSVGKNGGSNSKSAGKVGSLSVGKVGGSLSKSAVKVGGSHSKSLVKVRSDSKSEAKVAGSHSKSVGKVGSSDSKSAGKLGSSDSKSAGKVVGSNSESAGKVGGSNSESVGKVGGSNSKSAGKVGGSKSKSAGTVGGSDSKSAGKVGGSDSKSAGNVGGSDSKSAGAVGGSDSKSAGAVGGSDSKSTKKVGGSDSKSAKKFGGADSKSAKKAGGADSKSSKKVDGIDSKSVGKFGVSDSKSAEKVGGSDESTEKSGGLDPKSAKNAGGLNSKSAKKAGGSDSKSGKKASASDSKTVRGFDSKSSKKVSGADSKSAGKVSGADSTSVENVGASDSKYVEKVGGADAKPADKVGLNSKSIGKASGLNSVIIKQKPDPKSSSSNVKLKRKAGADELEESRNGRLYSVLHTEKEDSLAVNNGHIPSKKRRSNSKKKTDTVIGRDVDDASKKKSEPSLGSSVLDTHFIDSDDEENLEQNAARMLSSRFDPSCTGFSPKRKPSVSQTANEFSFPVASSLDKFGQQANSSIGADSASADDSSRPRRPRRDDKGKGVSRKRRHFYQIMPRDLDPHWFLNRRIKVFWPLDESWYYGVVIDYHPECKVHHVKYDDRDEEWIDLEEEKFKILLFPNEVPGRAKSKRVSPADSDVHKEKKVAQEDDDTCRGNDLDSEPIALWLARSSQRGKSLPKSLNTQTTFHMELPTVSSLLSEKTDNLNSNVADSKTTRSNPDCVSADNLVLHGVFCKSVVSNINGNHVVYVRKKNHKKSVGNSSLSRDIKAHRSASGTVGPLASVTVNLPSTEEYMVDPDKQLWSIDDEGMLRLNVVLCESTNFRFQICLSVLPSREFSLGTGDSWLLQDMFMLQHGTMLNTSPAVMLEMLFMDSYLGLRFLLFEGCMKEALAFVFLILRVFSQPAEHVNGDMHLPVTSIRFRLSSFQDVRKHHVFQVHSFSRLQSSRWFCLDSKLLQHCLLIKQLPVSECTYDNVKELECRSLEQCKPHFGLELSSFMGFNRKFASGILPMGVSEEACNTRISGSALSPGKVPKFALSFSAAPTFFLALHLQLLMKNGFDWGNLHHHDVQHAPESPENGSELDAECVQMKPSLVAEHKMGTLDTEAPASFASSNEDLVADVAVVSNVPEKADSRGDSQLGGITVDIPSGEQVSTRRAGKRRRSRQMSDVGLNVNEGLVHSPSPTGSGFSWRGGRSRSISSLGDLSPVWSDASPKFMRTGFGNGPRRPRTQVQYTLPGADYDFSAQQKMHNQRAVPYRRIRRASLKKITDGSSSNKKNFDLVACDANVLVTHGDKGWREHGALIVLEIADHNEWRLAIKLSGITKYSYKVKHILQPGSTNRYSHSLLWKGGKDWVLEFPDRSQWNLFKELHEECYNRNVRAASVKNIPIPGVQLVEESDDYETEFPFVRNSTRYIRQVQTDVEMALDPSRILYDMDSDDEQWLMESENWTDESRFEEISEDFLEKTMDMFEKVSYFQHRENFTDAEIQELAMGMGSVEAVKLVYEHWREKRGRKGMPLIRHLQPPLWERYQQQLKEWEHTVARGNSAISVGTREKVPPPEKPPMFAFCQKPRGLDVPNKGSKQRSHRKSSVSGHFHAFGDHSGFFLGRRANSRNFGDEKVSYTSGVNRSSDGTDVSESNRNPKVHKTRSRKLSSYPSSSNQQTTSYNQRTRGNTNEVQPGDSESPSRQGAEQSDGAYLDEFRARGAARAAKQASNVFKLRRDRAHRLFNIADLFVYKANSALMIRDAIRAAHGLDDGN